MVHDMVGVSRAGSDVVQVYVAKPESVVYRPAQELRGFTKAPERVFIVHGESDASEALRERIQRELNWHASVPMQNQEFAL